jgi:phage terminase small subunit
MPYLDPKAPIPTKGKGSKLTDKQTRFIEEYLVDLNATAAVLRAGYVTTNPNRIATDLLRHPLVKRELDKMRDERRERMEATVDYVVNKLINIIEKTEEANPNAALRGLELVGKHLGMYKDRQEISGPDGAAIQYQQKVKEDAADFASAISRLIERGRADEVAEQPNTGTAG